MERVKMVFKNILLLAASLLFVSAQANSASAGDDRPAKPVFGAERTASAQNADPIGFYSKGCMAGAVQLSADGPHWQAMRLMRNRRWGEPQLISFIEKFSQDAAQQFGWPGLLIGDMSQPRGGPMINGHASHQIGLDADIWYAPMPDRRLTGAEREKYAAVSMLKKDAFLTVDPSRWSEGQARLVMLAASYPQVQRIFVNPAIKKKLCESWTGDRSNLGKVRPLYGHTAHFHVRLSCPPGAADCQRQADIPAGDGCGKELAWWFSPAPWKKPAPRPPGKPAPKPHIVTVGDLPRSCEAVLAAPGVQADGNMGMPLDPVKSADADIGTPITALESTQVAVASPVPASRITAASPPEPSAGKMEALMAPLAYVPLPTPRPLQ